MNHAKSNSLRFPSFSFLLAEIRNHGVGYYQFSTDEGERQEQMKALDKLREQVQRKVDNRKSLSASVPRAMKIAWNAIA